MKYFVYFIIVIVAGAVIAGFFVVGSPQEARLRGFDEKKIQDLQFIQGELINYWQNKEVLPVTLSQLNDDIRGVRIPQDPQAGSDYAYLVKGPLTFALCANFNKPSSYSNTSSSRTYPKAPYPVDQYIISQNWDHGDGDVCFERTIDKDLYQKQRIPALP